MLFANISAHRRIFLYPDINILQNTFNFVSRQKIINVFYYASLHTLAQIWENEREVNNFIATQVTLNLYTQMTLHFVHLVIYYALGLSSSQTDLYLLESKRKLNGT